MSWAKAVGWAGSRYAAMAMMRTLLYEAANTLLTNVKKWSWLKAWAMNVAKRRGKQKAVVALAAGWR